MRMKAFVMTSAAMLLMASLLAPSAFGAEGDTFSASSGIIDGETVSTGTAVTYKVTAEGANGAPGTVQAGDGSGSAVDASYSGRVVLPQAVEHGGKQYRVTVCGASSFAYAKISGISFPSSIVSINSQAFYSCTNLSSLDFGEGSQLRTIGVKAFQLPAASGGIQGALTIPATVRIIGNHAFAGQVSITSLAFDGQSMESIGTSAFEQCLSLKTAEVPALTAENSALGALCFNNDTALEFVLFKGDIASNGNSDGPRTFENCMAISNVVFRGKKNLPYYLWSGSSAFGHYDYYGFQSNPNLYYTVVYYASYEDALAKERPLGSVAVRSDTTLLSLSPSMQTEDAQGKVVYEGAVCEPPAGYSGWAYEGSPRLDEAIDDSLYAYPVDASDVGFATVAVSDSYVYTGKDVEVSPQVYSAAGDLLKQDADYQLVFLRKDASGQWTQTQDLTSPGELEAQVTGMGDFHGSTTAEFSIAQAQVGSVFAVDGVSYCITALAQAESPGQVSVGDGSGLAVDAQSTGVLSIPASVSPQGSALSYQVTSVADLAFGGATSQAACTGITSVELPDTLVTIGNSSFAHCEGLEEVSIPASVTSLGARCFQGCVGMESLRFEGSFVNSLGAFCFEQCASLAKLTLPAIGTAVSCAFADCPNLTTVELLGTVGSADVSLFSGCDRLTNIIVPGARYKVLSNGNSPAVSYVACTATGSSATVPAVMTDLGIRFTVTTIGAKAFASTGVKTVVVKSKSLAKARVTSCLASSKVAKVKVPASKLAAYKKIFVKKICGKKVTVAAS